MAPLKNPPEFLVDWVTAVLVQLALSAVAFLVYLLWRFAPAFLIAIVCYASIGALVAGTLAMLRRRACRKGKAADAS